MGNSGLNYSVGFLRYRKAQSGSNSNRDILIIAAPVLAGVIILTLTLLSVGCCAAGVMIRRKRAYKAKRRYSVYCGIVYIYSGISESVRSYIHIL